MCIILLSDIYFGAAGAAGAAVVARACWREAEVRGLLMSRCLPYVWADLDTSPDPRNIEQMPRILLLLRSFRHVAGGTVIVHRRQS